MNDFDVITPGALTSRRYRTMLYERWLKVDRIPLWIRKALNNELAPCIVGGHKR